MSVSKQGIDFPLRPIKKTGTPDPPPPKKKNTNKQTSTFANPSKPIKKTGTPDSLPPQKTLSHKRKPTKKAKQNKQTNKKAHLQANQEKGTLKHTTTQVIRSQVGACCFVIPAGGLGERLGFHGVKLALPAELVTPSKVQDTPRGFFPKTRADLMNPGLIHPCLSWCLSWWFQLV